VTAIAHDVTDVELRRPHEVPRKDLLLTAARGAPARQSSRRRVVTTGRPSTATHRL
jgi:hypothetical protein